MVHLHPLTCNIVSGHRPPLQLEYHYFQNTSYREFRYNPRQ